MNWKKFLKRYGITSAMIFALIACSSKPTPETKEAISILKGLNSKLDVGINIVGYADALRDTKVAVDQAIESEPKAKDNQVIEKVMDLHLAALELWHCKTEYDYAAQNKCRNNVYETVIFPLSPEVQMKIEPEKQTAGFSYTYYAVDHDNVLQLLWGLAETELNSLESK